MDFNVIRGQSFSESFDFKGATGKPVAAPTSGVVLILERGADYIRRYEVGHGLNRLRTNIVWKMDEEETKNLPFDTLYYTLYIKDQEFLRGVVRVQ